MRWTIFAAAACLLLALQVAAQKADNQNLRYRWTDAAGQLHLADEIPPDAVRGGYDLINQYGNVVRHVDGAKTPAEIAAEKARAVAAQKAAEQARADQQLLLSYPEEKDLAAAQHEHLTMLQQRIESTEINMKSQLDGLANLLDQAASIKQQGNKVPAYLESEIKKQQDVIAGQRTWLKKSRVELATTKQQAADTMTRYRRLRGANGVHPALAGSAATP